MPTSSSPDTVMSVPQGDVALTRPGGGRASLRAWDAADEMLLQHVAGLDLSPDAVTVIVGDSHGALSIPLAGLSPTVVVDRFSSRRAIATNAEANGIDPSALRVVDAVTPLPERIDLALVRPARTLAMLEHQLRSLAPSLHPESVVVASSMVKHLHTSTLEVFERVLGPTTTSLARRRARLVHTEPRTTADAGITGAWDWPKVTSIGPGPLQLCWMPGVFSAGKLDRGTALLLAHLPDLAPDDVVVDLGCGNGVLGLVASVDQPDAAVTLVDDSSMAVAAARATLDANGASGTVVWGDGLTDWAMDDPGGDDPAGTGRTGAPDGSVDIVLCNPPFHDDHALVDAVAWKMFSESRRALRPGGEIWVVGNRHLGYHVKLRRLFGDVDVVSSDPKFVVLHSVCP